ncbi:MAG: archaeosine biosynthesis radical SAM protein RaSEA [Halanaerobiales bacterium]|nr:archaeosine biosynthesis radical SAM protein RaSEA [Halanaerobiales bacterium]
MEITHSLEQLETLNTQGPLKNSHYFKIISELMGKIHEQIVSEQFNNSLVATSTETREENFQGVNYKRAVMYLMSNGCEWARKSGHGCTMCGHLAKQTRTEKPLSVENYLEQFEKEFANINLKTHPLLNLYNNGSFFNDNEIQAEARIGIYKIINQNPDVKMVVLETRPEFVDEEKIQELKTCLPDKYVEIAIGLEMKDDFLRYLCINKGFSLQQYNRAAKLIIKDFHLRTYVMLKPPFLMEKESIDQVIETIHHAFSVGSTTVSLETCTIQDYTLVNYLAQRNSYQTAWLWSILEVVQRTAHLGKLIVGLFQFYPSPTKVPYNCEKCSDKVINALCKYNKTLDVQALSGLDCDCKKDWEKTLNQEDEPLLQRLNVLLD